MYFDLSTAQDLVNQKALKPAIKPTKIHCPKQLAKFPGNHAI